jgi:hypothetical protein
LVGPVNKVDSVVDLTAGEAERNVEDSPGLLEFQERVKSNL